MDARAWHGPRARRRTGPARDWKPSHDEIVCMELINAAWALYQRTPEGIAMAHEHEHARPFHDGTRPDTQRRLGREKVWFFYDCAAQLSYALLTKYYRWEEWLDEWRKVELRPYWIEVVEATVTHEGGWEIVLRMTCREGRAEDPDRIEYAALSSEWDDRYGWRDFARHHEPV